MSLNRHSLATVAFFAALFATGAHAQDTGDAAQEDADATTNAEGTAESAGSEAGEATAAEDGAAEPLAGDPGQQENIEIDIEVVGDWEVRCAKGTEECFMFQAVFDPQNNPVAEVNMVKLSDEEDAAAGVTVLTPLGTLLPAGLVVQIDEGEARQYPYSWCTAVGCLARYGLTDQSVNAMKRGRVANIRLTSFVAPEQPITLGMSLTGFTDAYNSLKPVGPAPAPAQ